MNEHSLDCSAAELSLGAFVLGSLSPSDREEVELHLRGCTSCSAIVAELAPLPALLHRVDLAEVTVPPAPPEVLTRALDVVHAETRIDAPTTQPVSRRRWVPVVALVAAAAVATVLAGVAITRVVALTPTTRVTASATDPTTHVAATVSLDPTTTGTELGLTLTGVQPGQLCSLVAVGRDGHREVAASWVANYEGEAQISGTTSLSPDEITRLEVTTPAGSPLVEMTLPA